MAALPRHSTSKSGGSCKSRKDVLDETDTSPIVVYYNSPKLKESRCKYSTQRELYTELDRDPPQRCSKKWIPRGQRYLEITTADTQHPDDLAAYRARGFPTMEYLESSSQTSVKLPWSIWLKRMLSDTAYPYLYIVSPDASPEPTVDGSSDSSKQESPSQSSQSTRATTQTF